MPRLIRSLASGTCDNFAWLELPLRPHPRVLSAVGVDGGVVRTKKVLSMYDHIVQVDAQLFS